MTAFYVLQGRCPQESKLTVAEVDDFLSRLAQAEVDKNETAKMKILRDLLRS